ncbi:MAG: tryptophan synthase subunit alpha [Lachnospiraceae bacterium]|nr:tryptophan synthase subunit alpha [Lachnospiraceae bacterium]
MTDKIRNSFDKNPNNKAFITFITAGDPDIESTYDFILKMADAGADIIEIGIPFSDPVAEGPVIQNANVRALKAGTTTDKVFEMVARVRKESDVTLCFMTYANLIFHYGYDKFFSKCRGLGVSGVIVPDMPYEEKEEMESVSLKYDVEFISMVAPTSEDRVKMIASEAKGFIYVVSSMGVTGMRKDISTDLKPIIENIRHVTDTPCAIGFGISDPETAEKMASISDGAIVGSAIVKLVEQYGKAAGPLIYDYVKAMKEGVLRA